MKKSKIFLVCLLVTALLINLFPASTDIGGDRSVTNDNSQKNSSNIQIHLFDYSTGNSEVVSPSNNYNAGINKGHEFKFLSDAGNLASNHMNKWTGSHGFPRTGIVETKLVNGYPKLVNGESLAYLFDNSSQTGKTSYLNVDGLFQVDSKGYTYFNSDNNYAEYDASTNSFVLKDVIMRKGKPFPCFYPFDSYKTSNNKAQGNNGVDTQYNSFTANNANHYFGMTVETEFYTLEDGKINGEDMVFNFSGDDDVWVFIDNTLVLDIGGIHTAVSGSINFNTGKVTIANDTGNRKDQGNIYTDYKIDRSDYTKHTLKVFYLERGNSASNCNISFNMPTIPDESIVLTKKVVDESGKLMDADLLIDFRFLIKKNEQPLADTSFVLYTENGMQTGMTDSNGCLYLKNGHTAVFSDFSATDTFEIVEIDYALNGYNVTLNGHEIVVSDKSNSVTNVIPSASSGVLFVKDTQNIVFKNIVEQLTDLYITKDISEENYNIAGESFEVELELNGRPYVGEYSIDNQTYQTNNGKFTLRNNETVKIEELPYGTSFTVSEPKDETYTQNYTFSSNVYDVSMQEGEDETAVYGRIGGSSEVVSINREIPNGNSRDITVRKEWTNDTKQNRPQNVTFDLYKNGELFISDVRLDASNGWSYTFENLFAFNGNTENVYSVVETKIGNETVVNNIAMGYYSEIIANGDEIVIKNTYGGDIVIKKTINDRIEKNPIFMFKITDRFGNVQYEVMQFSENETTKELTVHNIALGGCVVEEIDVIRYETIGDSVVALNIVRDTVTVKFENGLTTAQYYTDTNYAKNHFVVGENMERTG